MNTPATLIRPDPPPRRAALREPAGLGHRRAPARPNAARSVARTACAGAAHTDASCHVAPTAGADRPAITTTHGGAVHAGHTGGAHSRHRARPAVVDG